MAYVETLLEAFEELRETAERFIDAGDRVVVFVTEARFRASAIELDERKARLVTYRDGKVVRLQVFRERADPSKPPGWRNRRMAREDVELIWRGYELWRRGDLDGWLERDLVYLWTVQDGRAVFMRVFRAKAEALEAAGPEE